MINTKMFEATTMTTSYYGIYVLIITKLKMKLVPKLSVELVLNNVYFMTWHIYVFMYQKIEGGVFLIYLLLMKFVFHIFIYQKLKVKMKLVLLIVG
jgi:hypothetical protein